MFEYIYWFSASLIVLTKFADIYTTYHFVSISGESNPFARYLMKRIGFKNTLILIGVLTCVMVPAFFYETKDLDVGSKLSAILVACFISIVQLAVAKFNYDKKNNKLISVIFYVFRRLSV